MLHFMILCGAVVAAGALLWVTIGQIESGRARELRRLAARRDWKFREPFDWNGTAVMARCFDVDVTLEIEASRVAAHIELEGEKGLIRRLSGGSGTPAGLRPTRTGDPEFDQGCEVFSETGDAPSWLTPALRQGLLSLQEPATVTKEENRFSLALARRTQDPALLARLVEIAAAAGNSDAAQREVGRIAKPIRSSSSIYWRLAMVEIVVLPIALVALYFGIRPTEVAERELDPTGKTSEVTLDVRAGDVFELWQDARFDTDGWRGKEKPTLRLEIETTGADAEQRMSCNPYLVNNCTVVSTVGNSSTLIHGENCHLEECGTLRADRPGTLRVRARLTGDDRSTPYVLEHRLRLKRRSRWLSF